MAKKKPRTVASRANASDPMASHATSPTTPPVAAEPISRPSRVRSNPPTTNTPKMTRGLNRKSICSPPKVCCGSGAGSGSPSMTAMMRSTPAEIPPAKSPVLNFGVMIFVDDAPCRDIGQRALETVADLDAKLAVVLGDEQDRAVVDLLAPDLPGLRDPDRILLDRFRRRGRHDQHRDLAALPRLEILQRLRQRGDVGAADSVPV